MTGTPTVVIATRDREASLMRTLERLEALPERPPIVVADNGSSDGTAPAVRRAHPDVMLLELGHNRGAVARTLGARLAAGPYVAFSDDDSWWAPGSLARAAAILDRFPDLALVAARVVVGPEESDDPICARMTNSPLTARSDLPGPPVLGFIACAAVVRQSAFLEVGGFDPRIEFCCEELMLAVDLRSHGWELAYVPELVAHHHPSPHRDAGSRRRLEARNLIWFAWLRLSPGGFVRSAVRVVRRSFGDRQAVAGLVEAVAGLPRLAAAREPIARELERELRRLDP